MDQIITYTRCPVCESSSIRHVLNAEDYTVSHQQFEIWECGNCGLRFTQNVPNVQSIGKYYQSDNYISHSNTSKGIVNNLYHRVRRITLKQKRNLIKSVTGKSSGALLDVGAGTGAFASFMRASGWQVTGLEPDPSARKIAQDTNNISLLSSDTLFQLPSESFDMITLWHVLEHVHQLHDYLDKFQQLLKPGGKLLIAVPNYTSGDATSYQSQWAAYDVPRHLYHFSPSSMRTLMSRHKMTVDDIKPMWFDSFYVSMLSEKYKSGRSNVIGGAWKGVLSNTGALFNREKCSSLIYVISR